MQTGFQRTFDCKPTEPDEIENTEAKNPVFGNSLFP